MLTNDNLLGVIRKYEILEFQGFGTICTDILDITIINLKENGNCAEVGEGSFILDYKRSCHK